MSKQREAAKELARRIRERFDRYREGRRPFEARWEEAYYNTLGEYAPGVTGQWRAREAAGSRVFVRLTRQKVREACRRVEPALRSLRFDLVSPDQADPAHLAALKAEIERLMALGRVPDRLAAMVWDAAWSGTGILRAPVLAESNAAAFGRDRASGLWEALPVRESFPAVEAVSIWNFYPDPDAPSIEEGEGVIQYHRLYPHQLRALLSRAGYDAEAVSRALDKGQGTAEEDWERSLRAAVGRTGFAEGGKRLALLEYWGSLETDLLARAGVPLPEGAGRDAEAVVVVVGDEVLKAAVNPWEPSYRPYLRFRWEPVPHQFWGVGVAENVRDAQKMINGASRLLVDNKALAGNCMFEIDVEALAPGQDLTGVYPGRKWVLRPGARGPAIRPVSVPDVSGVLLEMIQLFENYADAASGVATPPLPETAANATGLSIALSAAGEGLRSVVRRLDDEIVEPLVERVYRWVMEYGDPRLPKGPARVRAVSTATAQAKEIRSGRLLDFLNVVVGKLGELPVGASADDKTLAGRVDVERLVEELAEALDVREILKPRAAGKDKRA